MDEKAQTKFLSKKKGRPKGSKNKRKVVETRFGAVIENVGSKNKKVLDQLLFSATSPSENIRQIPQNDVKRDHVLIKGIGLEKNMQTGKWEVGKIDTNHGAFATGKEQTDKIDQRLIRTLVAYLRGIFEDDLKGFIERE